LYKVKGKPVVTNNSIC